MNTSSLEFIHLIAWILQSDYVAPLVPKASVEEDLVTVLKMEPKQSLKIYMKALQEDIRD